jgi:GWxTD domain-containing protein
MKNMIFILLLIISTPSFAQALRDINFNYLYEPHNVSFDIKTVRDNDRWTVFYKLECVDTAMYTDEFSIAWETRKNFNEKEGISLAKETVQFQVLNSDKHKQIGKLSVDPADQNIIVAKINHRLFQSPLLFFKVLDPKYPVNAWLKSQDDAVIFNAYINLTQTVSIQGFKAGDSLFVSYYNDPFPAAAPAFAEGPVKVSKEMRPDSTFTISADRFVTFNKTGLYLVQKDTAASSAMAFRVENAYPKFIHLDDLAGPLTYVSTRLESDKLRQADTDKKKFDKVVLDITRDAERARNFMRTYFRRTERANVHFTSYKEGWKTDRGMIYLVYGPPQKILKHSDREEWFYGKNNLTFVKAGTLFDPDNYVLLRNKRFKDQWYEQVDLVRSSRF